jgi:hypothetical protein
MRRTEHRDYQILGHPARQWVTVAGIRSTGLTASSGIAEYVAGLFEPMLIACGADVGATTQTKSTAAEWQSETSTDAVDLRGVTECAHNPERLDSQVNDDWQVAGGERFAQIMLADHKNHDIIPTLNALHNRFFCLIPFFFFFFSFLVVFGELAVGQEFAFVNRSDPLSPFLLTLKTLGASVFVHLGYMYCREQRRRELIWPFAPTCSTLQCESCNKPQQALACSIQCCTTLTCG